MNVFKTTLLAAALATAGFAGHANAAETRTADFQVTISIIESCTITATNIEFGNVVRGTADTAEGTLTVNCSDGTPYAVTLGKGQNSDDGSRRMANGSNYVPYGLYADAGHTTLWDATLDVPGKGSATNQEIKVYGQVTAEATNVPRGDYTDTVTATVTY